MRSFRLHAFRRNIPATGIEIELRPMSIDWSIGLRPRIGQDGGQERTRTDLLTIWCRGERVPLSSPMPPVVPTTNITDCYDCWLAQMLSYYEPPGWRVG